MTKSVIANLISTGLAEANPNTQVTAFTSIAPRKPELSVVSKLLASGLAEANPNTQVTAFTSIAPRKAA